MFHLCNSKFIKSKCHVNTNVIGYAQPLLVTPCPGVHSVCLLVMPFKKQKNKKNITNLYFHQITTIWLQYKGDKFFQYHEHTHCSFSSSLNYDIQYIILLPQLQEYQMLINPLLKIVPKNAFFCLHVCIKTAATSFFWKIIKVEVRKRS